MPLLFLLLLLLLLLFPLLILLNVMPRGVWCAKGENRLGSKALEALGWLSLSAPELMRPFIDSLIPFIITSIQDSTSVDRREVCMQSIDHIVRVFACAVMSVFLIAVRLFVAGYI